MNQNIKIAVLGGGGKTGKYLVNHLIEKGYGLKILLRNLPVPDEPSDQFSLNLTNSFVEIVKGDAVNFEDIHALLSGCQVVISTIGQRPGEPMVASIATGNILKAMREYGIRRYILVAGINIDTPFDKKSDQTKAATEWMKSTFPTIHKDRAKSYDMLIKSDVDWTLVRLPMIEYTDQSFPVGVNSEDCLGSKISTKNIAVFLEEQLSDKTYVRKAPFLYNI
ncbi:NAD(P)-dependent oxidoreductase [Dyadobacter frigoris]|uniref:NADH-flavin reductase n=1 Tax=Dyadobacter frigoris TaxID=2576211 RepID=A0A4U6D184_9BACT|nr:NAD(P)H-binding protein [Dyadobacter frigoris]TKT90980.1 NADH-flavin reductase [Dyadobacter frigoris]GLU56169.1 NADH-flavin reductase [Dyadobacter frigoris]